MPAPAAGPAGGFLTGVKGWLLLLLGVGVLGGLVYTGWQGSVNTFLQLGPVDKGRVPNDFGAGLYIDCIQNHTTFEDGDWQAEFTVGDRRIRAVSLTDLEALVELGTVYAGGGTNATKANYRYRPEVACHAVCQNTLKEDCRYYTYDGLIEDSCRFVRPQAAVPPAVKIEDIDLNPHFYVYNGTCVQAVREAFLKQFDEDRVDLTRPAQGQLATSDQYGPYIQSLQASLKFLRAQWAGVFNQSAMAALVPNEVIDATVQPDPGVTWKKAGFVGACSGEVEATLGGFGGVGSFASGDHIVSTFGVAHSLAELSVGRLWWQVSYDAQPTKSWVQDEIVHQGVFLVAASQTAGSDGILVGVGDQVDASGNLLAYASFSTADYALLVGEQEFSTGQQTSVPPVCTYSTASQPAADVAAAAAAGLSLGSLAVSLFTQEGSLNISGAMLTEAMRLLDYSMAEAPINGTLGVDVHTADSPGTFGASQVFTVDRPEQVHAHQFWAACSLWQQTGEDKYWDLTMELFNKTIIEGEELVYFPVLNYRNPSWYGVMCMAQSAPSYSGIETRQDLGLNETLLTELFLEFEAFEPGSRAHAENLLWSQFVFHWVTTKGPTIKRIGNFRYRDIETAEGEPVEGMLRDSASAALLALMYADLPGITEDRQFAARCFALQQVDFLMGDNSNSFSYQVNLAFQGASSPRDVWHKDAACDPLSIRSTHYTQVFKNESVGPNSLFPRVCDYTTFAGGTFGDDPNFANTYRPNDYYLTGALVSWFDPTASDSGYIDNKFINGDTPNNQARVRIDYNSALAGAAAGLAALPASFYQRTCPSAAQLQNVTLADT